jgi:phosphomannomutase
MMSKSRIFLFDVDGTLTPPRQKMTQKFEKLFGRFVDTQEVFLVSGSDIEKIRQQVPAHILSKCSGIFGSSGNEYVGKDGESYKNSFKPPTSLISDLENYLNSSLYKTRTGKHIEYRPGMINFSIVGRNATLEQRSEYNKWDSSNNERGAIAKDIQNKYPGIDVKVGGQISVDIYPRGLDKAQSVEYVRDMYGDCSIVFFGDRTDKDGNDYSVTQVVKEGDVIHPVESDEDTYLILESYMGQDL